MRATGSIVLSKLQAGQGDINYQVKSSAEEIVRTMNARDENGKFSYSVSPSELEIWVERPSADSESTSYEAIQSGIFYLNNDKRKTIDEKYFSLEGDTNAQSCTFWAEDYVLEHDTKDSQISDFILTFEGKLKSGAIVQKTFIVRNRLTAELAKFNLTAEAINQSVGQAKMSFTQNGLKIKDASFTIVDGSEKQIFGVNEEGSLMMRGVVYATDGEFSGKIKATEASFLGCTISGFMFDETGLKSTYLNSDSAPSIQLNGETGVIFAEEIHLGKNATIEDSICLGSDDNAFIYNPDENQGQFIKSGDIVINSNGTAWFGNILVDGNESELRGDNWKINNNYANFSNVNISGSIESVTFKTNSVQAAGGTMIFRPSYKGRLVVTDEDTAKIILEERYEGTISSIIEVVDNFSKTSYFATVLEGSYGNIIVVQWTNGGPRSGLETVGIVDYGESGKFNSASFYPVAGWTYYETNDPNSKEVNIEKIYSPFREEESWLVSDNISFSDQKDYIYPEKTVFISDNESLINALTNYYVKSKDVIIGINSGNSGAGYDGKILPRGLTLTDMTAEHNNPHLYLGDLQNIGLTGYGLYADNVYLTGSLTTQVDRDSYAGVNTLNGVSATAFDDNFEKRQQANETDTSRIVFWAGSEGRTTAQIQQACFQVTERGSLYAQRAKLEDTLLVGGIITASEIHTARLYGEDGALSIYDCSNGIEFKKAGTAEEGDSTVFSIKTEGLLCGAKRVIDIAEKVKISGDEFRIDKERTSLSLVIANNTLAIEHQGENNKCGFYFEETNTNFKTKDEVRQVWSPSGTEFHQNLELIGNKQYRLQYKAEEGGYNLYVTKEQKGGQVNG